MTGRSASRQHAIIVGGSMAGLYAALSLRRIGWTVQVCERIGDELEGRGAGIATHPEMTQLLHAAGIDRDVSRIGAFVPSRRLYDGHGRVVEEIAAPQTFTTWSFLRGVMRRALPDPCYAGNRNVVRILEHDDGLVAECEDGTLLPADIVIAADGIHSTTRRQFLPDAQPRYSGYIAWRGLVEASELAPAARDALTGCFAFGLPTGEQMVAYPVAGEPGSPVHVNFVWYRPAPEGPALDDILTDIEGRRSGLAIAPDRIRPAVRDAMRAAASERLGPLFADMVERTRVPLIQPIVDFEAPRLALGRSRRIIAVGDAAFVARPHVGMGVMKAMLDVESLARALESTGTLDAAIDRFELERLAAGRLVVDYARWLGSSIAPPPDGVVRPAPGRSDILAMTARSAAVPVPAHAALRAIN
jgi:2-polyprenyl-6-methoxyphenol hydroxylase-like FAD-dependent oxidoreductase